MSGIQAKLSELYSLEQLSSGKTVLHGLHPAVKLSAVFCYLVCVMSFPPLCLLRLVPYLLTSLLVMEAAEIPFSMIFKRTVLALPFCLFAGITNLIFARDILFRLGFLAVTSGMLSFAVILLRAFLCVSAVLILMALTPLAEFTAELRRLHVPEILILLFEMTFRYVSVLAEEAASMLTAYRLRSSGKQWPELSGFGPFAGHLLLRSSDRAARVYAAMQCRLYGTVPADRTSRPLEKKDAAALALALLLCISLRVFDWNTWLGGWLL